MWFISKPLCCNTSMPGVRDPFTFLALQRFDEVDRGWGGCVESAVRSIFCTHLCKTAVMQKCRAPRVLKPGGIWRARPCAASGFGGTVCARLDFLAPARILVVSGEQTRFASPALKLS